MHGEIRQHDTRLSDEAFDKEKKILKPNFKPLLLPKSKVPALGGWSNIIENMAFEMEGTGGMMAPDNETLPAAYTYFGQLLAHDITAHRFFGSIRPSLSLRTIYGMGPGTSPQYYQHEHDPEDGYIFRGVKMVLDHYKLTGEGNPTNPAETIFDFIRVSQQNGGQAGNIPLMADARNDQNFITSQLVVKFVQLHNRLAEAYYDRKNSQGHLFKQASMGLVRKYQRVILTDYLPRILHSSVDLKTLAKRQGFKVFDIAQECRLSEVFARAAMRYGHTQVRQMYQVQLQRQQRHLFNADGDLRGFNRDTTRKIDWICLLDEGVVQGQRKAFQPAKSFDTNIVLPLVNLPFLPEGNRSLIEKNIESSYQNFILDGNFMQKLNGAGIKSLPQATLAGWTKPTGNTVPLWIYLLLEAGKLGKGETLGPLGSQIVAEQIMWALLDDPESVLRQKDEKGNDFDWEQPYTLKDLLTEAGEDFDGKADQMPDYWKAVKAPQNAAAVVPSHKIAAAALTTTTALTGNSAIYTSDEVGLSTYTATNSTILLNGQRKDIPQGDDGMMKRSEILNNGHYLFPSNEPDIAAKLANGTLPPDSKKRREIRCYISRAMILNLCGGSPPSQNTGGNAVDIKGLFFIFGLDKDSNSSSPHVCLMARRTGINGTFPTSSNVNNPIIDDWIGSKEITTVNTQPIKPEIRKPFVDNFIIDQFSVFKSEGLPKQTFSLNGLLGLLDYQPLVTDPDVEVTVRLIFATGQEIANGEGFALAGDQINVKDTPFFALTLDAGGVVVGPGRPHPYWCYSTSI